MKHSHNSEEISASIPSGDIHKSKEAKNQIALIIMISIVALIAITFAVFFFSGSKGRELKKCLNLGQQYLTEMNYDQAIASFKKALELDPLSADAYLGMAEVYREIGDLEKAEKTLETGIEVLGSAGYDTSLLSTVLTEIQDEIARIAEEKEAARKAEEDAQRKLEEEAKRQAKEDARLAALPYLELQPMLDSVSNVWGRSWDSWDSGDFIAQFGLHEVEDSSTNLDIINSYADSDVIREREYELTRFRHYESFGQSAKSFDYDYYCFSLCIWKFTESDYNHDYSYEIIQNVYANHKYQIEDYLYTYARERGLFSIEAVLSYFGLTEFDLTSEIAVNSDLGEGVVSYSDTTFDNKNRIRSLLIEVRDYYFCFSYSNNHCGIIGDDDMDISIIKKFF